MLVSGAARAKLEDEVVELKPWDALRVAPDTMRGFEAGPDGPRSSRSAPARPATPT